MQPDYIEKGIYRFYKVVSENEICDVLFGEQAKGYALMQMFHVSKSNGPGRFYSMLFGRI